MSPRNRGWHTPHPAWMRRSRATTPLRTTFGDADTVIVTARKNAPAESWWTKPVKSREEFDRRASARGREAGWIGRGVSDQ
jgi:hypothetical protein